jgi:hypothetical protein
VKKQNCWEFKQCGRGPDRKNDCAVAKEHMFNGLHGGMNAGRACWVVAGTGGGGPATGTFAIVSRDCLRCDFFKQVEIDELGSVTGFSVSKLGMMKMLGSKKPFLQNALAAGKHEQIDPHLRNEFVQEINKITSGKIDTSKELKEEFAREVARLSSSSHKKGS